MTASDHVTISVENVVKRFGDFTAVNDVSFTVRRGEIFGLLGPNGSGKTTTIRMMLGLLQPTSGYSHVLGQLVETGAQDIRWRVGYMAQRFSLYNDLTVAQNLRFYGQAYGLGGGRLRTRMADVLELAGLTGRESDRTKELSGGWRQRLALAAALIHEPEVIFLDEPTAGVDPVSRREFWELLYQMVAKGVTVFVTTHYMDEAEHCHRLGFLQRGRMIALGSPSDIKTKMMRGVVVEIEAPDSDRVMEALRRAAESGALPLAQVELYGSLVHAVLGEGPGSLARTRQLLQDESIPVLSMDEIEPSLEDVFIACMQ